MKRMLVLALLLCPIPRLVLARTVKEATMLEYGIYAQAKQERIPYPDAPAGYVLKGFTETLTSQTNVIPAKAGIKFGFRYSLKPQGQAEQARIKIVYLFPKMTNPKTGKSFTRHEGHVIYSFGAPATYVIYNLEEEWEAVPGTWTLQIWEDGERLVEKKFELVKPESTTKASTTTNQPALRTD